ncbi:hypothetical protein LTR66_014245, partial [Elasticomyces elasticus]
MSNLTSILASIDMAANNGTLLDVPQSLLLKIEADAMADGLDFGRLNCNTEGEGQSSSSSSQPIAVSHIYSGFNHLRHAIMRSGQKEDSEYRHGKNLYGPEHGLIQLQELVTGLDNRRDIAYNLEDFAPGAADWFKIMYFDHYQPLMHLLKHYENVTKTKLSWQFILAFGKELIVAAYRSTNYPFFLGHGEARAKAVMEYRG